MRMRLRCPEDGRAFHDGDERKFCHLCGTALVREEYPVEPLEDLNIYGLFHGRKVRITKIRGRAAWEELTVPWVVTVRQCDPRSEYGTYYFRKEGYLWVLWWRRASYLWTGFGFGSPNESNEPEEWACGAYVDLPGGEGR